MKAKTPALPLSADDMTERELMKGIASMMREIKASLERSQQLSAEIEELKQESHRIRTARRAF